MGLVTLEQASRAADRELLGAYYDAGRVLKEATKTSRTSFDVFLSHSKMDEKYVIGAKRILEEKGFAVYVDWIDDPQMDRSYVNKKTADYLRVRMNQCRLMFYLHTKSASLSKWCPWELGFFDGYSGSVERTFIFPLVESGEGFKGQEYLELYPIIDIDNVGQTSSFRKDVWGYFPSTNNEWREMSSILEKTR